MRVLEEKSAGICRNL